MDRSLHDPGQCRATPSLSFSIYKMDSMFMTSQGHAGTKKEQMWSHKEVDHFENKAPHSCKTVLLLQRKHISTEMPGGTHGSVSNTVLVTTIVKFPLFTASSRSLQIQPLFLRSAV